MAKSIPAAKKPEAAASVDHRPTEADLSRTFAAQDHLAANERMRKAARRDPLIARLLAERDRLAAENATLRAQIDAKPEPAPAASASPAAPAPE